ncbi:MAG: AraC family transcriptional regulator [Eubacteriales bacterium]|nr:AraC family transcriptional regulator [Eubacteriales bacterium]
MTQQPLNVQCFVKKDFQSVFVGDNDPKLLYVSKIRPDASAHPRVMHAHKDFVEIILICSGISEYLIHDKKQYIRAGDLLVYNSGVVHDEISGPDIAVGSYCVAVGGLHMPGLRENMLIPDNAGYIFPTGDSFGELRTLCEMMYHSLSEGEPRAEAFCHSLMHALLVKTLAVADGPKAADEHKVEEPHILGRRIKEYIDTHYMEPITLQSMSETLHISPYYLSHVFKQMSGYSPVQYLLRRRIGEAQTLLITTDLPITRVAEMVGYDTQSYFNLQFTKNVGMPPKKYRQNYIVAEKNGGEKPKKKHRRTRQ